MTGMKRRLIRLACGLLLLAVLPLAWLLQPWLIGSATTVCLFRTLTGRPCVFCGLTRSVACAMRGRFDAAFDYNPLWIPALAICVAVGLTCLCDALSGSNRLAWWRRLWLKTGWWLAIGVVLGTIIRALATGAPA